MQIAMVWVSLWCLFLLDVVPVASVILTPLSSIPLAQVDSSTTLRFEHNKEFSTDCPNVSNTDRVSSWRFDPDQCWLGYAHQSIGYSFVWFGTTTFRSTSHCFSPGHTHTYTSIVSRCSTTSATSKTLSVLDVCKIDPCLFLSTSARSRSPRWRFYDGPCIGNKWSWSNRSFIIDTFPTGPTTFNSRSQVQRIQQCDCEPSSWGRITISSGFTWLVNDFYVSM